MQHAINHYALFPLRPPVMNLDLCSPGLLDAERELVDRQHAVAGLVLAALALAAKPGICFQRSHGRVAILAID